MAGNKKPRKQHRPRLVSANSMDWAMSGAYTLPAYTQKQILEMVETGFDALRRGQATRDEWNALANALNIAEALAGLRIGPNLMPAIQAGMDALHSVALRMLSGKSSTCHASELSAITEALDMYRIQLRLCSQAEMTRAVQRVNDLHRSGAMKDVARLYAGMAESEKVAA